MLTWQHFKLASIWNLKHLIVSQWKVMLLVVVLGNRNASIIKALAEACGCNEKVAKVFNTFQLIAEEKKKNHMKALPVAAPDFEPLYMTRLLQQTLLAALGHAAYYSEKLFCMCLVMQFLVRLTLVPQMMNLVSNIS
ncbi:hypothetical protein DCAR_0933526 [Daucus carota subsp. sativus]|uniref:Uncharacterized protein n=1 Tax=Daucus carota subsp. sativus TaxID=79200 RepID=A0AAF0XX18_DAUCS|nr:hypothetical protein DCAR_0933526 [Daucus carota subsp. sativus]